jgi:hypothetical protein
MNQFGRRSPELPETVFRCARCGDTVGRFIPTPDGRSFRTGFRCPEHGRLKDPTIDRWEWEWEHRPPPSGHPLTIRLPTVQ